MKKKDRRPNQNHSFGVKGLSLLKKRLTEPTLLEMSGYAEFAEETPIHRQGSSLLQKPFSQQDLLRKVREALAG